MNALPAAPSAEPLQVVAAVLIRDAAVLACRRRPGTSAAGLWEFPGGKVEAAESPEQALRRELREELGIDVDVLELMHRETTRVGELDVDLACYACSTVALGPIASTDHDRVVWHPLDRLDELNWALPDLPTVTLLSRLM
ncbi:(deoxy)nucleoside triphosphate pyrophosphohydrolase [Lysinimonas soli]|uniref:8-oxo-dGTP diphosphatase n=1 Tax=Lysinimonas soli TaxID=1074233 RepID=A0ABW0NJ89_9MICO